MEQERLFSVISNKSVQEAFSQVLRYYVPEKSAVVVDVTCSVMKMWSEELRKDYEPVTMDIREEVNPQIVGDCALVDKLLGDGVADCIIYDPPYLDIKARRDSSWAESAYSYETSSFEYFEQLSRRSATPFYRALKEGGILICKITNFHYKGRLRGTYDLCEWFGEYFYLWDEVVYRFYKHIPNLNWYKRRVPKTHSYFLVFKKKQIKRTTAI